MTSMKSGLMVRTTPLSLVMLIIIHTPRKIINKIKGEPQAPLYYNTLSLQIYKFLKHRIGNCDDTGVSLETTLGGDHFGKFCREVNV